MKRSAAILGPTRPMLRWAIGCSCDFRDLEHPNLPDSTFKQLRVLRAASVAKIEGRICEGIVLHPNAGDVPAEEARGFPLNEAVDVHGGCDAIEANCGDCPANVPLVQPEDVKDESEPCENVQSGSWVGCFGWLRFDESPIAGESKSEFQKLMRPEPQRHANKASNKNVDWVRQFEEAVKRIDARRELTKILGAKFDYEPAWFGVWSKRKIENDLLSIVSRIVAEVDVPNGCIDFWRFRSAIDRCHSHSMPLYVDLTPAGFSDGVHWRLEPQCQVCGVTRSEYVPPKVGQPRSSSQCEKCFVCQTTVHPIPARKPKVLGLRPYLDLAKVIGVEGTLKVVSKWQESRHN